MLCDTRTIVHADVGVCVHVFFQTNNVRLTGELGVERERNAQLNTELRSVRDTLQNGGRHGGDTSAAVAMVDALASQASGSSDEVETTTLAISQFIEGWKQRDESQQDTIERLNAENVELKAEMAVMSDARE